MNSGPSPSSLTLWGRTTRFTRRSRRNTAMDYGVGLPPLTLSVSPTT